MDMKLRPLAPTFGAEVTGVDLSSTIGETASAMLEDAFNKHSLLLIRDQKLSESDHVAASKRFGQLQNHVLKPYLNQGFPEILVLSNIVSDGKPTGIGDAGQMWHADTSYTATPCRCSLLYSREVPEPDGDRTYGDTVFLSAAAAYDALSDGMKRKLDRLTARHSYIHYYKMKQATGSKRPDLTKEQEEEVPPVDHPVVLCHPITGRKAIYVNPGYTMQINELSQDESDELLQQLFDHLLKPEFVYRHKWRVGDMIIWDNYATQHLAVADYALPKRRLMHRTTVLLDETAERKLAEIRGALVDA